MDVANEMVKELEITDPEPSEIAEMIAQEISSLLPDWKATHDVHCVYNYADDDAEDDSSHPFHHVSSPGSSQGSAFGAGQCLGVLGHLQLPQRQGWFQGALLTAIILHEKSRESSLVYSLSLNQFLMLQAAYFLMTMMR